MAAGRFLQRREERRQLVLQGPILDYLLDGVPAALKAFTKLRILYDMDLVRLSPDCVRAAEVPGKGRGLVAARAVAAGELLSVFPLDSLTGDLGQLGAMDVPVFESRTLEYSLECSPPGLPGVTRIYADAAREHDPRYLAHLANDCAKLEPLPEDLACPARLLAKTFEYHHLSVTGANAGLVTVGPVVLIATRPIAEGEEVTVNYGPGYWLSVLQNATLPTNLVEAVEMWGARHRPFQLLELSAAMKRNQDAVAAMWRTLDGSAG